MLSANFLPSSVDSTCPMGKTSPRVRIWNGCQASRHVPAVPNPVRASARIRTRSKLSQHQDAKHRWRRRGGAYCGADTRYLEGDWTAAASRQSFLVTMPCSDPRPSSGTVLPASPVQNWFPMMLPRLRPIWVAQCTISLVSCEISWPALQYWSLCIRRRVERRTGKLEHPILASVSTRTCEPGAGASPCCPMSGHVSATACRPRIGPRNTAQGCGEVTDTANARAAIMLMNVPPSPPFPGRTPSVFASRGRKAMIITDALFTWFVFSSYDVSSTPAT